LAGQLGGVVVLGLVQAAVYLAVGLAIGVHLASGVLGALVLFAFSFVVAIGFGALGAFAALRTGSGEAVQGLFPLFFVVLFIPSLLFPLFFFTPFPGGLSSIQRLPGFDFAQGYTAFQFVFVVLQSAAFGGVFTGFGIARDFESGFARRLLLAAPNRGGILLGYAIAALGRWLVTATVLTAIALAVGMHIGGSGVDVIGLYTLAVILNAAAVLRATGG